MRCEERRWLFTKLERMLLVIMIHISHSTKHFNSQMKFLINFILFSTTSTTTSRVRVLFFEMVIILEFIFWVTLRSFRYTQHTGWMWWRWWWWWRVSEEEEWVQFSSVFYRVSRAFVFIYTHVWGRLHGSNSRFLYYIFENEFLSW